MEQVWGEKSGVHGSLIYLLDGRGGGTTETGLAGDIKLGFERV